MNTPITATPATTSTAAIDSLETAGNVLPYNPAAIPAAIAGTRIITKTFKQSEKMRKEGKAAKPNVFVRIPTKHITVLEVTERVEQLAPYVVAYLQSVEDKTIEAYMAADGLRVFPETLSIDLIVSALEESGNTGLNSEIITTWFTDACAPQLLEILATKLGNPDASALPVEAQSKISTVIQSYLDMFISLASGKTQLAEAQRTKLAKCLELTGAVDTVLGSKFVARFAKMAEKEQAALESLGDLEL